MSDLVDDGELCIHCNGKYYTKGFCKVCHRHLLRIGANFDNKEECISALKLHDKRRRIAKIKKCIYCKDTTKMAKGFCNKHYMYLLRHDINMDDIKLCMETLRAKDKKIKEVKDKVKKKHGCIYCGTKSKVLTRGFCEKHYTYLRVNKIDFNDLEKCFKFLEEKYVISRKCHYCDNKHYGRGFCKKHYSYLKKHNIDLNNKEKCVEFLKAKDDIGNK